jgi:hypothetical protein
MITTALWASTRGFLGLEILDSIGIPRYASGFQKKRLFHGNGTITFSPFKLYSS